MSMSGDDHISRGGVVTARRIEVFTGAGRRREWSARSEGDDYRGELCRPIQRLRRGSPAWPDTIAAVCVASGCASAMCPDGGPEGTAVVPAFVDVTGGAAGGETAEEMPLLGFDLEGASVWICR